MLLLAGLVSTSLACGGEPLGAGAPTSTSTSTSDPGPTAAAGSSTDTTNTANRSEPIRLPYEDFAAGNRSGDRYAYTRTLAAPCSVVYERWWGMPPHPGAPMEVISVRSAMFAGAGGATPVLVTSNGEQRVLRRTAEYQANLSFDRCSNAEVDALLRATEVDLMPTIGTDMPAPVDVCMGSPGAMARHTVTPSRAGVYDPDAPIQGEHLNWTVPGAGCVTYPALSGAGRCEGANLPWVTTTSCQQ